MEFNFSDHENLKEKDLIERLQYNSRCASIKRSELEKIRSVTSSSKIEVIEPSKVVLLDEESKKIKEKESDFEKEVEYYLSEFNKLNGNYSKENLDNVLPSSETTNYKKIILRIIASSVIKDMKEIDEIIMAEANTMSKDELAEYKEELLRLSSVRELLLARVNSNNSKKTTKKRNKLIFTPMTSGKIRVFDEIKDIPYEDYELFIGLFNSIKDGTFKNVRRFVIHGKVIGTLEVKDGQARVVYNRLSNDCYAIISVFIKQSTNDKGYRVAVHNKIYEYKAMEAKLKEKLKDPKFLEKNSEYEEEVYKIFGKSDDTKRGCK